MRTLPETKCLRVVCIGVWDSAAILAKEPEFQANFSVPAVLRQPKKKVRHHDHFHLLLKHATKCILGAEADTQFPCRHLILQVKRYPPNPEAFWGPKSRARPRKRKASTDLEADGAGAAEAPMEGVEAGGATKAT